MRGWAIGLIALVAISQLPTATQSLNLGGVGGDDNDSLLTLVLLNMVTQRDDPYAMQSLYPLLLSSVMGEGTGGKDNAMYYLLLGAGSDSNMQQWLPLILNNKSKSISDKLLMLIFMQQSQVGGATDMSSMFPLLLLNSNQDSKFCSISAGKCTCESDNTDMLMYIMLLNGNSASNNNYSNFMFMMFNDETCKGKLSNGNSCNCDEDNKIEGGIDAMTYMMMMKMNPVAQNVLPESPPQRAMDFGDLLKKQMFANLGPEYAWMQNAGNQDTKELLKFQLYQQMGIPPTVMGLINSGKQKTTDERFALIQWMAQGSEMSIETMSLMIGVEDAKQFYIHSMIEDGNVDPMTASLLLASQGDTSKEKLKEMLIMAATGQIDPSSFATISKPYVPQLPAGTYPGQELYFIHLEMMDLNTCALIEPEKRKACSAHFGPYVTAEQCEVQPYCCYNPYFGEKVKVNGVEKDVPWCYYNIFFVFHDQYKLRIQEADQFKGPQDCPGLFRYGLNLDPFMYYTAVQELFPAGSGNKAFGNYIAKESSQARISSSKLGKLIHYRSDVGFPGITEFHCRAILGACWDPQAATYPGQYNIPQCFEEGKISDGTTELNLYDPELFKPIVPDQFRSAEGECDTNYFHISTLYYERRACTYDISMIKYGTEYSPLSQPPREDCLRRLGCCYEDNDEIIAKYPFMPRCYQRIKDDLLEQRLFQTKPLRDDAGQQICGKTAITNFINEPSFNTARSNILNYSLKSLNAVQLQNGIKKWDTLKASSIINSADAGTCLYINTNTRQMPTACVSSLNEDQNCVFWKVFDLYNKEQLKELYKKVDGIPAELQGMVTDLF